MRGSGKGGKAERGEDESQREPHTAIAKTLTPCKKESDNEVRITLGGSTCNIK